MYNIISNITAAVDYNNHTAIMIHNFTKSFIYVLNFTYIFRRTSSDVLEAFLHQSFYLGLLEYLLCWFS